MPMRIKTRLLIFLVPAIFVALVLLTFFSYLTADNQAKTLALTEANKISLEQSDRIFDSLRHAEASALSLASALKELRHANPPSREAMSLVTKGVAVSSKDYFGVWALWEHDAFDGKDAEYIDNKEFGNKQGRANSYWMRDDKGELVYDPSENYDQEPYYALSKEAGRLFIVPPYRDLFTPDNVLMSSITAPVRENGRILGVVGVDIELEFISGMIKEITPYDTGYAMLISDSGAIIADPRNSPGKSQSADLPRVPSELLEKIKQGQPFSLTEKSFVNGEEVRCFYTPVKLESFVRPWYFMVALPMDKAMAESNRNLLVQFIISIVAVTVLVGLVFYTASGVSKPLQRIAAYAQDVAGGNHDAYVDRKGFVLELHDLQTSLRSMLNSLLASMKQAEQRNELARQEAEKAREAMDQAEKAREASEENRKSMLEIAARVDAVSAKLQETSQVLNDKITVAGHETQEQNNLMGETVVAISGMADSIVRVSENAGDAAKFTEQTRERAKQGADIVNSTLEAFDSIRKETEALGLQIEDLNNRTESIGDILGMINDIADQTNLLALNAAIEAARAGEAGRGFAVVADEVRKLAEKTVQATNQVEESINGIRSSMRISAQGVARATETVNATVSLGHEAQSSLADIVGLVQGMNEQIHDIANLCRDQAATSEQVADIVDRLRQLSIVVSEAMDEGAAITRTLEPEARELGLLVEQLTKQ